MIDMEGMPPTCRDAALETIAAMDLINAPTLALRNIECTAGGNDYHQLNKFLESPVARNRVTDLKLTVRAPADLKDSVTAQNFSIPLGNIEKLKNLDISLSHELCGHINFARTERIIASVSLNFFGSDKKKSGGMYRANYEAGLASDLPKADKINLKGKVFDLHAIPIYVYHNPHVKEINLINSRESGSSDSIYTDLWLETSIERMTVKITKTWKPNEFGYEYRPRTGGNNLFGNPNRASHKIKVSVSDTVS